MKAESIVAIGASNVFGRVDPKHGGFVGRLKTWHERGTGHSGNAVFNLGIPGQTSSDILRRVIKGEIGERNPDLTIVSIVLNDARKQGSDTDPTETSLSKYEDNVRDIIKEARKQTSGERVIWCAANPIDDSRTQPLSGTTAFFHSADVIAREGVARRVCETMEVPVPYFDTYELFPDEERDQLLAEDGLHMNAKGHQKVFEALRGYIAKL